MDSHTSDEEQVDPRFMTSIEERPHGTIKGSAIATQMALMHSCAQANSIVEKGPADWTTTRPLPKDKAVDKSTQTLKKDKDLKNDKESK